MSGRTPLPMASRGLRQLRQPRAIFNARRSISISTAPAVESPTGDVLGAASSDPADARFEILGAPYSLLSVSLSASQQLYTRRGTLVGVSGKAENAQSTLSLLEPVRRAPLGIPFLYQKVSSTNPITALISTKSPLTSFTVLHLNGTVDWMVAQRKAILAWTGHTLTVTPTINRKMNLAHWGNSLVRGRGLVALSGPGNIYQVSLKDGEEYVAHPGNVVAYTITQNPPQPFRFTSAALRFQIPDLGLSAMVADVKFIQTTLQTKTWKALANFMFYLRTTARTFIWGDRLFMQFRGPATIILSSRASRISDVLTSRDVNEIADAPAGVVQDAVTLTSKPNEEEKEATKPAAAAPTAVHFAEVRGDGKVKFGDATDLKPEAR